MAAHRRRRRARAALYSALAEAPAALRIDEGQTTSLLFVTGLWLAGAVCE